MAESGIMVSAEVATAAPVDALPWPVVAMAACAAVRTALLAALLLVLAELAVSLEDPVAVSTVGFAAITVVLAATTVLGLLADACVDDKGGVAGGVIAAGPVTIVGALTLPALSCVDEEPLGWPPEVLIQICLSMDGRCQ
jgi:hypothetical protein